MYFYTRVFDKFSISFYAHQITGTCNRTTTVFRIRFSKINTSLTYIHFILLSHQGGKSARVVNTVLALKSYSEGKQTGGNGISKFGANIKPTTSAARPFVRKNSEPFTNSLSRTSSMNDKSLSAPSSDLNSNKMVGKLTILTLYY